MEFPFEILRGTRFAVELTRNKRVVKRMTQLLLLCLAERFTIHLERAIIKNKLGLFGLFGCIQSLADSRVENVCQIVLSYDAEQKSERVLSLKGVVVAQGDFGKFSGHFVYGAHFGAHLVAEKAHRWLYDQKWARAKSEQAK